jgi:hypothetical protein
MELTVILAITTVIFLVTSLYFAFNRKVVIKKKTVIEIDPELENKIAGYEHTLRSIAYDTKTIKAAKKLADDILEEEKE